MTPGEIRQLREDRGLLLDLLNSVYPNSLAEAELIECLIELPRPIDSVHAQRDLGVLRGRHLIERLDDPHPITKQRQIRWRLTADGVTFVERNKPWGRIEGDC